MIQLLPTIIGLVVAMVVFILAWRAGAFLKLSGYFAETQEELRKCTWPTWDELLGSTVVVVVAVAILGSFTVGADAGIAYIISLIV